VAKAAGLHSQTCTMNSISTVSSSKPSNLDSPANPFYLFNELCIQNVYKMYIIESWTWRHIAAHCFGSGNFAFVNRNFFSLKCLVSSGFNSVIVSDSDNLNKIPFIIPFLLIYRFDKGWSVQKVILHHFN